MKKMNIRHHKKRTLPTVSVFVSAYNEEANISRFLRSVLKQKEQGFVLEKIYVVSDGSSDATCTKVRSLKSRKIVLVEDRLRKGKSTRLNEWYKKIASDIIVQSDADVVFSHSYVIAKLIHPLLSEKKVMLVGGNPRPVPAQTFTEKAINYTVEAYTSFRFTVNGGHNAFSADGRLLALSTTFAKKVTIPEDMIANDAFVYFSCLAKGYKYRFAPEAVVYFRSPKNISDHLRQNTRFRAAPLRLKRHFSTKLVEREYHIPQNVLLLAYIRSFVRNPFLCGYIFLLNKYCAYRAILSERQMNAKWPMAGSTKRIISAVLFVVFIIS